MSGRDRDDAQGIGRQVRDDLWTLIVPPTVWAVHFLLSYVIAAYRCAPNADIFKSLDGVRLAIAALTVLALAMIAWSGRRAWREWRLHGGARPHDADTAGERERLLEFSTVLLAALSATGVVFVALPALLIGDCR